MLGQPQEYSLGDAFMRDPGSVTLRCVMTKEGRPVLITVVEAKPAGMFDLTTSGELLRFSAEAVVIATGGWPNTGMRDLSGEGIAQAWPILTMPGAPLEYALGVRAERTAGPVCSARLL